MPNTFAGQVALMLQVLVSYDLVGDGRVTFRRFNPLGFTGGSFRIVVDFSHCVVVRQLGNVGGHSSVLSAVMREALPSKSILFVQNLELLNLTTYELSVFQELAGDMRRGCKFSWSKGLHSLCGAYATASCLLQRRASSCSSGSALRLVRGVGSSVLLVPVVRVHYRDHAP